MAAHEAGDFLKGKLPDLLEKTDRNSYAHVFHQIKQLMGKSYKDCDDDDTQKILEYIEFCKNNPC